MEANNSLPEGFKLDTPAPTQAASQEIAPIADSSSLPDGFQLDSEKYGSLKEMGKTALEGLSQGVAGPLAPLGERAAGINPEDIRGRAEENPWVHGLSEATGFVGSMFTGVGEAALLGRAGQAAVKATGLGLEGAGLASRLAAGATKVGTEMALMQAGDEATKAILQDPEQSAQSAVANIGLSAALGALTGGALKGIGIAGNAALEKTGLNGTGLKEFTDRLAYRGSGVEPNEVIQKEFGDAIGQYHSMNDELLGPSGLKAQALEKLMPKEMTPAISEQIQQMSSKAQEAIQDMTKKQVPERYIKKFINDLNAFEQVVTDPKTNVSNSFDALNDFKKTLQGYSKGNYGPFAVPSYHEAYDFLNITKSLGHEVKNALENPKAWGEVADLQKSINKSWHDVLPAVKDVESKFMSKIGGEPTIDPAKFNTYINQSGKATSSTIRQEMMGKFIKSFEQHQNAIDDIYKKAGVKNPFPPVGMGALKESLQKQSPWAKAADLWYDKMLSRSIGEGAGASVGAAAGHATGLPGAGIAGAYIGKQLGENLLPSIIQPMLEKVTNLPGFHKSIGFMQSVLKGDSKLVNSTKAIFGSGLKQIPKHLMPDSASIDKLDSQLEEFQKNPSKMFSMNDDLGHYMPNHSQALAQVTANAVNYLNSMRPQVPKLSPLDQDIKPSKAQEALYKRTLQIAEQPMMVLKHVKEGTIIPDDIKTLNALYPKLYGQMSKHIMTAMTEHLADGGSIPYHLRQSLSMFLAMPLDSTMLPSSIMSVQMMYAGKQAQGQQQNPEQKGPPKSTAKLSKVGQGSMTANQSREARANRLT